MEILDNFGPKNIFIWKRIYNRKHWICLNKHVFVSSPIWTQFIWTNKIIQKNYAILFIFFTEITFFWTHFILLDISNQLSAFSGKLPSLPALPLPTLPTYAATSSSSNLLSQNSTTNPLKRFHNQISSALETQILTKLGITCIDLQVVSWNFVFCAKIQFSGQKKVIVASKQVL